MKLNMISNPAVAADTQPVRHWLSECTLRSGRAAAAEHFGAGFIVLPRPWAAQGTGGSAADFSAPFSAVPFSAVPFSAVPFGAVPFGAVPLNPAQPIPAQLSTAATSGPCASKQYQQMAPAFATSGGEVGPHPPRDPV
jgi:hypothetical protein